MQCPPTVPSARRSTLARDLVGAWGCWAPDDDRRTASAVAFVSDRTGPRSCGCRRCPQRAGAARRASTVCRATRCCRCTGRPTASGWPASVATGGGVRTQVWVRAARTAATRGGSPARPSSTPCSGPWTRQGHRLVVTCPRPSRGRRRSCASTRRPAPASRSRRAADRRRSTCRATVGSLCCATAPAVRSSARSSTASRPRPPAAAVPGDRVDRCGALSARPPEGAGGAGQTCYLVTDAGLPRRVLLGRPVGPDGRRGAGARSPHGRRRTRVRRRRRAGRLLVLVLERRRPQRGRAPRHSPPARLPVPDCPGEVVTPAC